MPTTAPLKEDGLYNNKTGARVRALGVVHVFGNMADMPRLLDIARRYKLILIEDATEALGTRYTAGPLAGKAAGTMGDIGCYSFNGNKIMTTGAGRFCGFQPRRLGRARQAPFHPGQGRYAAISA